MMDDKAETNIWSRGYEPGNNWMMCDLCGLRFRSDQMQQQPHGIHKGLWVCPDDFEEYNPQFKDVKGVPERLNPKKINPEPTNAVIGTNISEFDEYEFAFYLGGYDGSQKITADDL